MDRPKQDTFQILIATDSHLGFEETDPVRGDDSFISFEEILTIGRDRDVDFILLGGDLFHANKPSISTIYKCLGLLRKYCMGDKPISVQFLGDQAEVFKHSLFPVVNYEDPNLNISIPVYSIHGNHDDPSGQGCLSALDLINTSGLVNYFGKWTDLTKVTLTPLTMRKGASKIAIYGLSHIKDDRLARLFRDRKVEFKRPDTDTNEWFYILVLHQNRVDRGVNKYIQDSMIPDFINFVVWGHEHESKIHAEWNSIKGFKVLQPGSSVATSLCEGEAVQKHIAILHVHRSDMFLEPIQLQTVRPFVFDTISLSKCTLSQNHNKMSAQVQSYLSEHVEIMLDRARDLITGHPKQPRLPLIRLRVDYSKDEHYINAVRFGQSYTDSVANFSNMLLFKKESAKTRTKKDTFYDKDAMDAACNDADSNQDEISLGTKVEKVIERYFLDGDSTRGMTVLGVKAMNEAITRVIEKDDKDALVAVIEHQKKKVREYLSKENVSNENDISTILGNFREIRANHLQQEALEVSQFLDNEKERSKVMGDVSRKDDSDSDSEMSFVSAVAPAENTATRGSRGGRGRGRGSRGGRGTTRARGSRGGAARGARPNHNSIADIFASHLESPPKRRKIAFGDDSD